MSAPKIDPTHKVPFTPLATDLFVRETINVVRPTNDPIPEFGTPHDAISKTESWPHHKFCWQTGVDEKGNCERWFVADPEHQHLYNWEQSQNTDWPTVRQVFVIPREDYDPTFTAYEAPPDDIIPQADYTVTGIEQTRIGDKQLDSLYVSVLVTREHIDSNPKISYVLDPQTNEIRQVLEEKVPAGTVGTTVNPTTGQYSEVKAINTLWALKTTQFMAGLAGKTAPKTQVWTDVINYSWPDVLGSINFYAFPSSSGAVNSISARPVYRRQRYDGPCEATITEEWTPTPPLPSSMTPMQPMEIQYFSPLVNVNIPPCLHPELLIYTSPGTNHPTLGYYYYEETYPATTLQDWPAEYTASYTVRPAMGGYLSRKVVVKRPTGNLFANVLTLNSPLPGTAMNSFNLSWAMQNLVGTVSQYRLDVNTKADFTGAYLPGFKNLNRGTNLTALVTGLTTSVQYFARVRAIMADTSVVVSNTQTLVAVPVAAFTVSESSVTIPDGGTLAFGNYIEGGSVVVKTITITNTGNIALTTLSRSIAGANANQWSLGGSPSTNLAIGASTTFTLTFQATSDGAKTASVTVDYTNALSTAFTVTGTGVPAVLPLTVEVDGTPTPSPGGFSFNSGGPYTVPVVITSNQEWTTLPINSIIVDNDIPNPGGTSFGLSGVLPTSLAAGATAAAFNLDYDSVAPPPNTGTLFIDYGTPSGTHIHEISIDVI